MGLASVIMGLTLFKRFKFIGFTTSVILGAITYRSDDCGCLKGGSYRQAI
ncbi:MAG: hypothetical protein ACLTDX_02900 [[Clostridium] innocuum]